MTVHLRNQDGGKAVINGGTFSGGATIVRSFEGSNTTITGGSFTNSVYPAVDVNGETLITGGILRIRLAAGAIAKIGDIRSAAAWTTILMPS